jgi:type II secretion system protein C
MNTTVDFQELAYDKIQQLLRPHSIRRINRVAQILIIVVIFYILVLFFHEVFGAVLGSITSASVNNTPATNVIPTPKEPTKSQPNYHLIVEKAVFGKLGPRVNPSVAPSAPPSQLQLELIGTIVSDDSPSAIIEDKKKREQDVFRMNEPVFGEGKLVAIHPDRVEIERNGARETLYIEEGLGAPSSGGSDIASNVPAEDFVVDEAELNKALENIPLLFQQARAVPYYKDGKAVGLRLFAVRPDSLYAKVGLTNGDILREINGKSLADPSQALNLFQELRNERSISLMIERAGQQRAFRYQIR